MEDNLLVQVFRTLTERNPKAILLTLHAMAHTKCPDDQPVTLDSWRACVDVLIRTVERLEAASDAHSPSGKLSEQRIVQGLASNAVCAIIACLPKPQDPSGHPMQARTIEPWLAGLNVCSQCGESIGANRCYQCNTCPVCICVSCASETNDANLQVHDECVALANYAVRLLGELQTDDDASKALLEALSRLDVEPEEMEVALFTVAELLKSRSEETRRMALKVIWQVKDRINSDMASTIMNAICSVLRQDSSNMLVCGFSVLVFETMLDKPGLRASIFDQRSFAFREFHSLMLNVIQQHGTSASLVASAMRIISCAIEHRASAQEVLDIHAIRSMALAMEHHIGDKAVCEEILKVISAVLMVEANDSAGAAKLMLEQYGSLPDLILRVLEAYPTAETIASCGLNCVISLVHAEVSVTAEFNVLDRLAQLSLNMNDRDSSEIIALLLPMLSSSGGAAGEHTKSILIASLFAKWAQFAGSATGNRKTIVLALAGIADATIECEVWTAPETLQTILTELEQASNTADRGFAEAVFKLATVALERTPGNHTDLARLDRSLISVIRGHEDLGPNLLHLVHILTVPTRAEHVNVVLNLREADAIVHFARRTNYQLEELVMVVEIMERLLPDGRTSQQTGQAIVGFSNFAFNLLRHAQGALVYNTTDACARLLMRIAHQHRALVTSNLYGIIPIVADHSNPPEMQRLKVWLHSAINQPVQDPEESNLCDICSVNPRNCVSCRQCCHPTCEKCDQRIRTTDGPARGLCVYCRATLGERVRLRL